MRIVNTPDDYLVLGDNAVYCRPLYRRVGNNTKLVGFILDSDIIDRIDFDPKRDLTELHNEKDDAGQIK